MAARKTLTSLSLPTHPVNVTMRSLFFLNQKSRGGGRRNKFSLNGLILFISRKGALLQNRRHSCLLPFFLNKESMALVSRHVCDEYRPASSTIRTAASTAQVEITENDQKRPHAWRLPICEPQFLTGPKPAMMLPSSELPGHFLQRHPLPQHRQSSVCFATGAVSSS